MLLPFSTRICFSPCLSPPQVLPASFRPHNSKSHSNETSPVLQISDIAVSSLNLSPQWKLISRGFCFRAVAWRRGRTDGHGSPLFFYPFIIYAFLGLPPLHFNPAVGRVSADDHRLSPTLPIHPFSVLPVKKAKTFADLLQERERPWGDPLKVPACALHPVSFCFSSHSILSSASSQPLAAFFIVNWRSGL